MNITPPDATISTAPSDSVESLIAYCRENSRVCPLPQRWSALWNLLPNRTRVGSGWQPPLPLILGAWHDTPGMVKMLRLAEQIEWAAKNGGWMRLPGFCAPCPKMNGSTLANDGLSSKEART